MKKQILKNILSNYIVRLIGMFLGLLVIPFLIGKLGKDAFGLIVLAESTIVFFEIATVSIRMALSRHVTFSLGKGKMEEFIEYLSTGKYILLIVTGLVFMAGSILSYNFSNIFNVPARYIADSRILFFLITVAFCIAIPNIIFWSVLYAKQKFDLINISMSIGLILRAVCIFIIYSVLPQKYITLITYGFIYIAMICLQNYMVYWWHKKIIPGIKISIKHFKYDKVGTILSFSAYASLRRTGSLLYYNMANILINIFWGPAFNAVYAVSLKMPKIMKLLFTGTAAALTPTFTNLLAKDDKKAFETLFFLYSKTTSVIVTPLSLILIFMAKPIISLWVGDEFMLAAKILPIHMLPLLLTIPLASTGCIINAYAKVKIPARVSLGVGIFNIVLIIIFVKVFSLGLLGVALATATSILLSRAGFGSYYACKISGIAVKKYWVESFIKPIAWACVVMGSFFLAIYRIQAGFYLTLLFFFILIPTLFIYYFGAYIFVFHSTERKHIDEVFKLLLKPRTIWTIDNEP